VAGEGFEVRADEGVDALLLVVRVEVAQANLDVGKLRDRLLFGGVDAPPGAVVPVDPQEPAVREDLAGPVDERLQEALGVEVEGSAVLRAGDQTAGGGVEVPRVDKDRVRRRSLRHLGEYPSEQVVRAVDAVHEGPEVVTHPAHCPAGHAANTTDPVQSSLLLSS